MMSVASSVVAVLLLRLDYNLGAHLPQEGGSLCIHCCSIAVMS